MPKLTIDGQEIEVAAGTSLFDACTVARGESLPHFCYHPDLPIAGVCRLCQVEIEGMPKLTIACNTTVRDGMVVHTGSERVRRAVQQVLEMHLINHPVDCPICDQAGECGLQDQYMQYGLYRSEVEVPDKVNKRKAKVIGPFVILDQERCVLCSRCVRFCDAVTGTGELGIFNRGDRVEIDVAPGRELANNYSLNTVDICPVGALTSRDFRFQKRVWLLRSTPSVCPGCATGCNVRLDHAAERVYRLKPRSNDAVNGPWMCDLGRLTYKEIHAENRLTTPLLRSGGELHEATWREAWPRLLALLAPGRVSLALANPHQSLEELVLFHRLAALLAGPDGVFGALAGQDEGPADSLLLSADRSPNRQALEWLQLRPVAAADLAARVRQSSGTVLLYGRDPAATHPELVEALQASERVVYLSTHRDATAELAAVVVPLSMWAEKDGLFVNRQGRIQMFRRAVAQPGDAREDWRVLADLLAERAGVDGPASLPDLRRHVAGELGLGQEIDLMNLPAEGLVVDLGAGAPSGGEG
jgi:NADH-quinone oxidoreductase subunit G